MKNRHLPYSEFKKKALKNKKVRDEYDRLKPYYEFVGQLIELRIKKKITQKQLAEMLDTKQPAIARLESGKQNVTLKFLHEIARACSVKLELRFVHSPRVVTG